ncbi:methyltransferase domain-containing protein [Niveispirillum sp. SYP-B3756]|uniref:class I SAM-dependent methyltransferase n=1 Tax=Niveispirillum sp. SYP-B3756 TaxID=2662178 RepID=UPI0012912F67|nr:methyltransferase domain-containing protein [Niveispirillum sp. SYP-B3756]MQP64159.1 methyltransferase domain-containing protein [Niveispirillum sp. SYP-B3756]
MSNIPQHQSRVAESFGNRAEAYVQSAVHAGGPDLAAMVAQLQARAAGSLLDLGCGGGHLSFHAAPLVGQVVAYDLSGAMLAAVEKAAAARNLGNISTRQGPAEMLPFDNASFDVVATRYSAHHWRNVPAALAEMRRVVRPGGRAMVMDVFAPASPLLDTHLQTLETLRDPSHVRDYSLMEWDAMLRRAGFQPQVPQSFRLRLEFTSWVERIGTPAAHIPALRSLLGHASAEVKEHFAIEPDGSFTIDTMFILADAA